MKMKEYSKGEIALQQALTLCEEKVGAGNPLHIKLLESLEDLYFKAGKGEEAIAVRERINKLKSLQKAI